MNNDFRHPPELLNLDTLWVVSDLKGQTFKDVPALKETYIEIIGKTVRLHDPIDLKIKYLAVYLVEKPQGRVYALRHDELQPVIAFQEIEESLWV